MKHFKSSNPIKVFNVEYKPALPGSYPPRLLMLHKPGGVRISESIWLHENTQQDIIPHVMTAERRGNTIRLLINEKAQQHVTINGMSASSEHFLRDGDFIQWKRRVRLIFQTDPVKDRNQRLITWLDEPLHSFSISEKIYKAIVINEEGLSLDGGIHTARWSEISYFFYNYRLKKYSIDIYVSKNGSPQKSASKIQNIQFEDFKFVLFWLLLLSPVDFSWNCVLLMEFDIPNFMMDAYLMAADEKIQNPAKKMQRNLPDNLAFVYGDLSIREKYGHWFFIISPLFFVPFIASLALFFILEKENRTITGLVPYFEFCALRAYIFLGIFMIITWILIESVKLQQRVMLWWEAKKEKS